MEDIEIITPTSKSVVRCGVASFEKYAAKYRDKQVFVVTDSNVYAYYRRDIFDAFGESVPVYVLPAGESSKSMRYLNAILQEMIKVGVRRNGYLAAVGGGVVGDIGGLAASLYMRGIHLVQIPTTLLAQVDSSVGGKTAIDFGNVKNAVGAFYQPEEVIVDPKFLQTLPAREIRCGLGEIVKYGALNAEIFGRLKKNCQNLTSLEFLESIIPLCIAHKAEVVRADEKETTGLRKTLNLGHTTGHAFELYYRKRSHGEFVLIGMFYELYIARKSGICGGQYADELEKLIMAAIKKIPVYEDAAKAADMARYDKKNSERTSITLVLPAKVGECVSYDMPYADYIEAIDECSKLVSEGK